ncbi:unnamed protein product [Trichogramma brassicae]|uniref:Uncharacterized protein n=1 Tax=Trichogramma brassicae TaxID=86971 RepID=A0A6H5IYF4_9HYME|nr:unnamed protein product [Trichogramma brassicae]
MSLRSHVVNGTVECLDYIRFYTYYLLLPFHVHESLNVVMSRTHISFQPDQILSIGAEPRVNLKLDSTILTKFIVFNYEQVRFAIAAIETTEVPWVPLVRHSDDAIAFGGPNCFSRKIFVRYLSDFRKRVVLKIQNYHYRTVTTFQLLAPMWFECVLLTLRRDLFIYKKTVDELNMGQYYELSEFYKFVSVAVSLTVVCLECTRLYLGYLGNLGERIPELASFWLISTLLQLPLELFLVFDRNSTYLPNERIANSVALAFLAVEIVTGTIVLKISADHHAKRFYMAQLYGIEDTIK